MPKTAVSANFNAHQLGKQNQNDKYYCDKTSEKKQTLHRQSLLSKVSAKVLNLVRNLKFLHILWGYLSSSHMVILSP